VKCLKQRQPDGHDPQVHDWQQITRSNAGDFLLSAVDCGSPGLSQKMLSQQGVVGVVQMAGECQ